MKSGSLKALVIGIVTLCCSVLYGQGSGLGYILDLGGSNYSQPSADYSQSIRTIIHNGFLRFHNDDGSVALQLMYGYRIDTVSFENYTRYKTADGILTNYTTDAMLKRTAWRLAAVNQIQFGRPGRKVFSLNVGAFYERTLNVKRFGRHDDIRYTLNNELNLHNFGIMMGAEVRFYCFTFGARFEKLFFDVIDHDYVKSQPLGTGYSSELRGLKMNPGMGFIYLGVNLDFFSYKD